MSEAESLKRPPPHKRGASTRAALTRVKQVLQQRLAELERGVGELGREDDKTVGEPDIRATNMLVRTLEKVLELERKDRASRIRKRKQLQRLDDAARRELVRRIEALPEPGPGEPLR